MFIYLSHVHCPCKQGYENLRSFQIHALVHKMTPRLTVTVNLINVIAVTIIKSGLFIGFWVSYYYEMHNSAAHLNKPTSSKLPSTRLTT